MNHTLYTGLILLFAAHFSIACSSSSSKKNDDASALTYTSKADFSADSAYEYVKKQVSFGPRVPGTAAHTKCANYIAGEFNRHGADTVIVQNALVTAFTGEQLPISNILAQFNKSAKKRVLIAAHYDTRPWADQEANAELRENPIDGANDGASGIGVILELARNMGMKKPEIGVDLLAVDAEDYGESSTWGYEELTWCLGTQYWTKHMPYNATNKPVYGIVLDMVGGRDARFHREFHSNKYAPHIVDKVWGTAASSPYASRFINETGGALIDDHVFINSAGIPCIDIVECNNVVTRSFPPTWHTTSDNMKNIDRESLKAAGQIVLDVLYNEKP